MELKVIRYSSSKESTLGLLFINNQFMAYTLEDEKRSVKVYGETCIPAGRYRVQFHTAGKFHARYSVKFPGIHKGMLHVTGVPGFKWILIHIGNDDDDTAGCLLVGDSVNNNNTHDGFISNSTRAYLRIYPPIAEALRNKEEVWIEYFDNVPGI